MSDFWLSSGHHLVDRDADGRLVVTDELLKAYLARPEVVPPEDACANVSPPCGMSQSSRWSRSITSPVTGGCFS